MNAFDFLQWALSGSFWRFSGAVILVASVGYSLAAGTSAATQAFAHILAGLRK